MFKKVIENIVKRGVNYLNKKDGNPTSVDLEKKLIEAHKATQFLFDKQVEVLSKRHEIINEQKLLISNFKPKYFKLLSECVDYDEELAMTSEWDIYVSKINRKINEHEILIQDLNDAYFTVEEINKEIKL